MGSEVVSHEKDLQKIYDIFDLSDGETWVDVHPVGSRATCDPEPGPDSDYDWLVHCSEGDLQEAMSCLFSRGYVLDNPSRHYRPEDGNFNSWRCGQDNIILTSSKRFHDDFLLASSTAKKLNLLRRDDRVTLFQAILYRRGQGQQT